MAHWTKRTDSLWPVQRGHLLAVLAVAIAALSVSGGVVAEVDPGARPAPSIGGGGQSAQLAPNVCAYDGQDVTGDTIALTGFHVSAPADPPEDGQVMSVEFTIENVGQLPNELDSVVLRAATPEGDEAYDAVSSVTLDPGDSYTFETEVTATEGDWQLWPAYVTANGQSSPSPWRPCSFSVGPPADTEPPDVGVELSPAPPVAEDDEVTITATASDATWIDAVRVTVDGALEADCESSPCSVTVGPLETGTHEYRVEAVDGEGNSAETTGTFEVVQSAVPLSVELDYYVPPPDTTLPTVIAARALGETDVESVTIVVDGEPAKTCNSPTCAYETRLAPGTEHTIGATAEDETGTLAESVGGVNGTVVEIPGTAPSIPPIVTWEYPTHSRVFERSDRIAFSVYSPDPLEEVRIAGLDGGLTDYRTLCGPDPDVPACPAHTFEYDEPYEYDDGYNDFTVAASTESGLHGSGGGTFYYEDPASIDTWVNASHSPSSPSPGESITITAHARTDYEIEAITSVDVRRLSFSGPDEVLATCDVDGFTGNTTCEAAYEPPDGRHVIYYYAAATIAGDREVTSTPRPVIFDDGPDADDDGLTDYEEAFLCTDERNPDTDGDALLDRWEVYGQTFPDGHVVDLPAMGAHPCRPDVFLEVDWWGNRTHSHEPSPYALTMVKQAFLRGGIYLHVDDGKYGGGEETPHHDLFDYPPDYYYENGYEYKLRKERHFDPHRLWTFHYAVFRHRTGRSAYMYANSINVQTNHDSDWYFEASELFHEFGHSIGLGHGGRDGDRVQRRNGDLVTYYGEWDSYPNRRPNYPSSMNYLYYGSAYWNTAEEQFVVSYDYSRAALPDLDESDLDERPDSEFARALRAYPLPATIEERPPGVADDWVPVVRYGCLDPDETERVLWYDFPKPVVMVSDGRQTLARKVAGEPWQTTGLPEHPPGIDWDCDGEIEASVEMNVNGDGGDYGLLDDPANYTWGEVLEGNEDWSKVPNRHPCPGDQQTQRTVPGTDEKYDVAPAPSSAYVHRGHDPPCDEVELASAGRLVPPTLGPVERAPPDRDHNPITAEQDELLPAEFCDRLDNDGDGEVDEGCLDVDDDGYPDEIDNCPAVENPQQLDSNRDYVGDACSGLPAAPAGLTTERADGGVRLSWDPVPGTSGYVIWRRATSDAPLEYVGGYPTTTTATFVDESVDPGESPTYVVRAVNAMTGAEGRAASVTYQPAGENELVPTSGGGSAVLLVGVVAALVAAVGAGIYVRRRRR